MPRATEEGWMQLFYTLFRSLRLDNSRICQWESDGLAVDFNNAISDNLAASMIYSEGIVIFDGDEAQTLKPKHQPGETVSTGHASMLKNLKSSKRRSSGLDFLLKDQKYRGFGG
ncbi:hypothetical protein Nepgr_026276 [Nepenthes gracilis]|uniref:Uncharacterized protein n=1 Tax=Nepenthes gracilis TaxID=150966 RepID=A0AAD3Y0F0_NEPGR|nr:hypothetical protein Nepgr_026276 [Nepenthes gracilis]